MWVADGDILKQTELEKKPLLEYWFLLNNKAIETDKAIAKNKALKNKRGGNRTGTD